MTNPYNSPKSVVSDKPSTMFKRSVWWKVYFYVLTFLSITGSVAFLFYENAGLVEYLQLLMIIIATAGLFGFVFNKKVFFPSFWLFFLIIYLLFGFFYEYLTNIDMREGLTDMEYYISMGIGYLISLPGYIALYLYSKSSTYPWKVDEPGNLV